MAVNSTFTPKASLTEAPTNLKEAIDWVLRVTGRDGKENNDECICGLAAAVTDLLQSVQLEYHGYQGDTNGTDPKKGATQKDVTDHLNGLFSLVQGLGGTAVVRTYIDQLAQVLSALVGWSRIETCKGSGCDGKNGNEKPHGQNGCQYLNDVTANDPCTECKCMKWDVAVADGHNNGHHLGRGCTRCKDSGSGSAAECQCSPGGGSQCAPGQECKCALAGKCCRCCCKQKCSSGCAGENANCSCIENGKNSLGIREHKDSYRSAYEVELVYEWNIGKEYLLWPKWSDRNTSKKRALGARILLGSVCLIWSGITYMHWTGKYAKDSPRWNNHILDGTGLDDGTLSQWLQALGFPKEMLNNHGPGNRLDAVIWNGLSDKLLLGFAVPTGLIGNVAKDSFGNTARGPFAMNYPGLVHTIHRDSFNEQAIVFKNGSGSSTSDVDRHKCGALYKLYILSCAYFTGLQKKATSRSTTSPTNNPKTIREILYWLSALPYSPAYKEMLHHAKSELEKASPTEKKLSFKQDKRPKPITVDEFNLFAHFQAVTQYCPLVLIGIQGGLHSTKGTDSTKEPPIHSLYANTECNFTYPAVSIQAYNQVVHYIRALFYQLYFLRKQCAVKVTCGGKWRECRYGKDVVSHGVISWMCLGCDPMEHDRKSRVDKVKGEILKGVKEWKDEIGEDTEEGGIAKALKELLEAIGQVVVQLGNAQEALEGKDKEAIKGVKDALSKAKEELEKVNGNGGQDAKLKEATKKLDALTTSGGSSGKLKELDGALDTAKNGEYDPGKNKINEAINKVREALKELEKVIKELKQKEEMKVHQEALLDATKKLEDICTSPKCSVCKDHKDKCGQKGTPIMCTKCGSMTTTGVPSPLQAFLEDRLPGFSCNEVVNQDKEQPDYPLAASHLGHCNGSGQCCPLPMGFRGHFQDGVTHTGSRLYGILYFFSNENMMQSCVYTLVRVTAALSATTPQVLGDVFGFFRGGVGNPEEDKKDQKNDGTLCNHTGDPSGSYEENKSKYFCGWCASGLRDEVKGIQWIPKEDPKAPYREKVGTALINIKGDKDSDQQPGTTSLSRLTKNCQYLSPLTGELYTAVSATFGGTYLSWVLYLSDALQWGLKSLASEFQQIECRGCKGNCDPNKCKKGEHGQKSDGKDSGQCGCQSIVSCTGVLPVLYRHGFSYGNPFNLEGFKQENKEQGDYSIQKKDDKKHCHEFLESLNQVIDNKKEEASQSQDTTHPLTELLKQVGKLQYDIRLPWIFVLAVSWLVAVLYLAFGAIWPLDWTHMRSHWLRGGAHQWQCMWYKVMTGRKGMELVEYFGRK